MIWFIHVLKIYLTSALVVLSTSGFFDSSVRAHTVLLDSVGDTFGTESTQIDIMSVSAESTASSLIVIVTFAAQIAPASMLDDNSVIGFIDFDTDQNVLSGISSHQSDFGLSPEPTLRVDFYVDLFSEIFQPGFVDIINATAGVLTGTAPINYGTNSLSLTIPLALLGGDDGELNYGLIVGTLDEATDEAPNGTGFGTATRIPEPTPLILLSSAVTAFMVRRAAVHVTRRVRTAKGDPRKGHSVMRYTQIRGIVTLVVLLLADSAMAYIENTHYALSTIAIRSDQCEVDEFLRKELLFPNGLNTQFQGKDIEGKATLDTVWGWVGYGSVQEDSYNHKFHTDPSLPIDRPLAHWYDPTRNNVGVYPKPATDPAMGLHDGIGLPRQPNSLLWAWDGAGNLYSWGHARQYYKQCLISDDDMTRQEYCALTFRSLGQVIHLLQDAAQPQHTRNDVHLDYGFFFHGSKYEHWVRDKAGDVLQVQGWLTTPSGAAVVTGPDNFGHFTVTEPLPTFSVNHLPPQINEVPRELMAYWDTEQYRGVKTFENFTSTPGLAELSNYYFVTSDTIFTDDRSPVTFVNGNRVRYWSPRVGEQHYYPYPKLIDTNFHLFWANHPDVPQNLKLGLQSKRDYVGETETYDLIRPDLHTHFGVDAINDHFVVRYIPSPESERRGPILHYFGWGESTWSSYAQRLLPKAISYSTGVLNYFFRGRLDTHVTFDEQTQRYALQITNLSGERFQGGRFALYQDDGSGNRNLVNTFALPGSLDNDRSFNVTFTPLPGALGGSRLHTLVYIGTIGNEINDAIAAKQFVTQIAFLNFDFCIDREPLCSHRPVSPPEVGTVTVGPHTCNTIQSCSSVQWLFAPNSDVALALLPVVRGPFDFSWRFSRWFCVDVHGVISFYTTLNININVGNDGTACRVLVIPDIPSPPPPPPGF